MDSEEKASILMVDDHPENLVALEAVLDGLGQNLVRAGSGREALKLLLKDEFALILLDAHMPGMDGFETAEMIRAREKTQNVPIIFITAMLTSENQVFKGYSLGAVDYIVKPVVPEILRAKVSVFIDLYEKTRQVKRQAELLQKTNRELDDTNKAVVTLYRELEKKNAELSYETDFINAVVDTAGSLVLVCDNAGRIVRFNRACEQTSGYSAAEVSGNRVNDLFMTPDEVAIADAAFERIAGGHYPIELEFQLVTRSGTRRLISWTLTALADSDGAVTFIIGTGIDITERNRAERALRKAHDELEVRVRDRTAELATANEALEAEVAERRRAEQERIDLLYREKEARQQAEAANRAKDEFLATVSHELRTPLNAILGWARMLRSDKIDEEDAVHAVQIIERNAKQQARLIEDLLDVSRIISGKMRLEIHATEVSQIVEGAVNAVRPAAEAKQVELRASIDPAVGIITCDPNRLQQVLWNLVSNAVKFTPSGGKAELIVEDVNAHVLITVRDTGEGIDREFLPYVFDRFRQHDEKPARTHSGLGLGLAIVRHLVEMHGGTVAADSPGKGQGATFTVMLPIKAALSPEDAPACVEESPRSETDEPSDYGSVSLDGLQVMVVDDDRDTLEMLVVVLKRNGAQVRSASSVADAIAHLAGWEPDLIVSDISMPGEDGYSLIRRVRALERERGFQTRAIALTAYASANDRRKVISAGFNMHVSKPVEPMDLIRAIANLTGLDTLSAGAGD
jgi:PAS domain S-box-containing protein